MGLHSGIFFVLKNVVPCVVEMIDDVTSNCLSISHTYLAGNKKLLCITFQVVTLKAVSISRLLVHYTTRWLSFLIVELMEESKKMWHFVVRICITILLGFFIFFAELIVQEKKKFFKRWLWKWPKNEELQYLPINESCRPSTCRIRLWILQNSVGLGSKLSLANYPIQHLFLY